MLVSWALGAGIKHFGIAHGYRLERRPDLKQYNRTLRIPVNLMVSSDEGVLILFDIARGNDRDKVRFTGLIWRYRELVDVEAPCRWHPMLGTPILYRTRPATQPVEVLR